jgi:hypothetical protein
MICCCILWRLCACLKYTAQARVVCRRGAAASGPKVSSFAIISTRKLGKHDDEHTAGGHSDLNPVPALHGNGNSALRDRKSQVLGYGQLTAGWQAKGRQNQTLMAPSEKPSMMCLVLETERERLRRNQQRQKPPRHLTLASLSLDFA